MKFEMFTKKRKTPRGEKLTEKKEKAENLQVTSSLEEMDRKGIKSQADMINDDNYNSGESEELVGGQESKGEFEDNQKLGGAFVATENIPEEVEMVEDEEGDMVSEAEANLQRTLDGCFTEKDDKVDPYGLRPLITELFAGIDNSDQRQKKKDREYDLLFKRLNIFLPIYRETLEADLGEKKEEAVIMKAFKEHIGSNVVYSRDEQGAETKSLAFSRGVGEVVNNRDKGQQIHYDNRGKGFLRAADANLSSSINEKQKGVLGTRTVKGGVKAYNSATGKKETI